MLAAELLSYDKTALDKAVEVDELIEVTNDG